MRIVAATISIIIVCFGLAEVIASFRERTVSIDEYNDKIITLDNVIQMQHDEKEMLYRQIEIDDSEIQSLNKKINNKFHKLNRYK